MFLDQYINSIYFDLIVSNYSSDYLMMLDEGNFKNIYHLLKTNQFYYIDDIILNYLELFELDFDSVEKALLEIKQILGEQYVKLIGSNMTIVQKIIDFARFYSEQNEENNDELLNT